MREGEEARSPSQTRRKVPRSSAVIRGSASLLWREMAAENGSRGSGNPFDDIIPVRAASGVVGSPPLSPTQHDGGIPPFQQQHEGGQLAGSGGYHPPSIQTQQHMAMSVGHMMSPTHQQQIGMLSPGCQQMQGVGSMGNMGAALSPSHQAQMGGVGVIMSPTHQQPAAGTGLGMMMSPRHSPQHTLPSPVGVPGSPFASNTALEQSARLQQIPAPPSPFDPPLSTVGQRSTHMDDPFAPPIPQTSPVQVAVPHLSATEVLARNLDAFDPFSSAPTSPAVDLPLSIDTSNPFTPQGVSPRPSRSPRAALEAFDPFSVGTSLTPMHGRLETTSGSWGPAWGTTQEIGAKSDGEGSVDEDDEDDGDEGASALEAQPISSPKSKANEKEYAVEFGTEAKLGMLLERQDEWEPGNEMRSELAVVMMVVDGGPAAKLNISVGSVVVGVAGKDARKLTYAETLDNIKNAPRPLQLILRRPAGHDEDNIGQCLFKKTVGLPRAYKVWRRKYFVQGGAVAKPNILQLYNNKKSYDRVVMDVFAGKRVRELVKSYPLNKRYKCSAIKQKSYAASGGPYLHYFFIRRPESRFKQLNFASTDGDELRRLRSEVAKFCSPC